MGINRRKFNGRIVRFRRRGYIRYPVYEIILTRRNNRSGPFIEKLGFYNPHFTERLFFIDGARLAHWIMKGAVINKTVKKYLVKLLG